VWGCGVWDAEVALSFMQPQNLPELIQQVAKREHERQASELADTQIKLLTAVFDKSTAYTNLMIIAGYAGFFSLWQITKDYLSKPQVLWSALLVFISLISFVLFEVTKMIVIQQDISSKAKALQLPEVRQNPQVLVKRLEEIGNTHERINFKFMRYWVVTMVVTLSCGLSGAGILAFAFISGLIN